MIDEVEAVLEKQIAECEEKLRTLKALLGNYRRKLAAKEAASAGNAGSRIFYGKRPTNAAVKILGDEGRWIPVEEVVARLVAGGNAIGKGRKGSIEAGLKLGLQSGRLVQHGDLLGLPEWRLPE